MRHRPPALPVGGKELSELEGDLARDVPDLNPAKAFSTTASALRLRAGGRLCPETLFPLGPVCRGSEIAALTDEPASLQAFSPDRGKPICPQTPGNASSVSGYGSRYQPRVRQGS
jgi:hypothetical protein